MISLPHFIPLHFALLIPTQLFPDPTEPFARKTPSSEAGAEGGSITAVQAQGLSPMEEAETGGFLGFTDPSLAQSLQANNRPCLKK